MDDPTLYLLQLLIGGLLGLLVGYIFYCKWTCGGDDPLLYPAIGGVLGLMNVARVVCGAQIFPDHSWLEILFPLPSLLVLVKLGTLVWQGGENLFGRAKEWLASWHDCRIVAEEELPAQVEPLTS